MFEQPMAGGVQNAAGAVLHHDMAPHGMRGREAFRFSEPVSCFFEARGHTTKDAPLCTKTACHTQKHHKGILDNRSCPLTIATVHCRHSSSLGTICTSCLEIYQAARHSASRLRCAMLKSRLIRQRDIDRTSKDS